MSLRHIKHRVAWRVMKGANTKIAHGPKKAKGWFVVRHDCYKIVAVPVHLGVHNVVNDWLIMRNARREMNR